MSESQSQPHGETKSEEEDFHWPEADGLLELLAVLVHTNTMEVPVTLFVRGTVVTGTLVSRRKWLDAYLEAATGDATIALVKAIKENLAWHEKDDSGEPETPIRFLHLAGAQIVHSHGLTPPVPQPNSLWRGRITEVSAWQPGKLS